MDEKMQNYMDDGGGQMPPAIDERQIVKTLNQRRKRTQIVLLSLAGLLWALVFYLFSYMAGFVNHTYSVIALVALTLGYIGSGVFASFVIKYKKVGV